MPVTHRDSVPIDAFDGKRLQVLEPSTSGADGLTIIWGRFTVGSENPPHRHDREEIVILLRGRGTYTIGAEAHQVAAGDVVVVPPGTVHGFRAAAPCEAIGIVSADVKTFAPDGTELA